MKQPSHDEGSSSIPSRIDRNRVIMRQDLKFQRMASPSIGKRTGQTFSELRIGNNQMTMSLDLVLVDLKKAKAFALPRHHDPRFLGSWHASTSTEKVQEMQRWLIKNMMECPR